MDPVDRAVIQKLDTDVRNLQQQYIRMDTNVAAMLLAIEKLVTIERFNPVQYIAYGLAGGVMTTVLGAILSLVLTR